MNVCDRHAAFAFFERNLGSGMHALRLQAVLEEAVVEGHGEAAGVRSAEQFFGVGAAACFEPRHEAERAVIGATAEADRAAPFLEGSLPGGLSITSGHRHIS